MLVAPSYEKMVEKVNKNYKMFEIEEDYIGILFTRPSLETGKRILENLEYYHYATSSNLNFYFPGFYDLQESRHKNRIVAEIDENTWYFSNKAFNEFVETFEMITKWEYSGESELLIVPVINGEIHYDQVLSFYLDDMLRDNTIPSIHPFLQRLFNLSRRKKQIFVMSLYLGGTEALQFIKHEVLEQIPCNLGRLFRAEQHYCVRNIKR